MLRRPHRASSPLPPVAEATRAVTLGLAAAASALALAYAVLPSQRAGLAAGNGLTDLATAVLLSLTVGRRVVGHPPHPAPWPAGATCYRWPQYSASWTRCTTAPGSSASIFLRWGR